MWKLEEVVVGLDLVDLDLDQEDQDPDHRGSVEVPQHVLLHHLGAVHGPTVILESEEVLLHTQNKLGDLQDL